MWILNCLLFKILILIIIVFLLSQCTSKQQLACQQGYLNHSLRHHAEEEVEMARSYDLCDRMTEISREVFLQMIRRPKSGTVYLSQPKVKIKTAWGCTCTSSWGVPQLSTGTPLLSLQVTLVYLSATQLGFCLFLSKKITRQPSFSTLDLNSVLHF